MGWPRTFTARSSESAALEVALQSHAKAEYLKREIAAIPGWTVPFSAPTFNEFVVEAPVAAAPLLSQLARRGILAGVALSRWEPEHSRRFLIAATEMNTRAEMDRLVSALSAPLVKTVGEALGVRS